MSRWLVARGHAHARTHAATKENASPRARGGRALTSYPRTFVVNAEIVLRQAYVAVLVLGAPGARQRRLLLVHHRVEQLQPVHRLALPRIRFPRLHNTPFIAGGGHHCHPLPHSPRSGLRRDPRFLDARVPLRNVTRATLSLSAAARAPRTAPTSTNAKRAADRRACQLLAPPAPPPSGRLARRCYTPRENWSAGTSDLAKSAGHELTPFLFSTIFRRARTPPLEAARSPISLRE